MTDSPPQIPNPSIILIKTLIYQGAGLNFLLGVDFGGPKESLISIVGKSGLLIKRQEKENGKEKGVNR